MQLFFGVCNYFWHGLSPPQPLLSFNTTQNNARWPFGSQPSTGILCHNMARLQKPLQARLQAFGRVSILNMLGARAMQRRPLSRSGVLSITPSQALKIFSEKQHLQHNLTVFRKPWAHHPKQFSLQAWQTLIVLHATRCNIWKHECDGALRQYWITHPCIESNQGQLHSTPCCSAYPCYLRAGEPWPNMQALRRGCAGLGSSPLLQPTLQSCWHSTTLCLSKGHCSTPPKSEPVTVSVQGAFDVRHEATCAT